MAICECCGQLLPDRGDADERLAEILDHCERAGLPLMLGRYLAVSDVAAILQRDASSVRRYLASGELLAESIRGRRFVHVLELARFLCAKPCTRDF